MLSDEKLSDLFFNHEHPNYERVMQAKVNAKTLGVFDEEEVIEAVHADAVEFASDYPEFGKDWTWYAKDFLRRL